MQTKSSFRQHYRFLRSQVSLAQRRVASLAIRDIFIPYLGRQKKTIAVYLAHDNELDLSFLIEALWLKEMSVFLPVIHPETHLLEFFLYTPTSVMQKNRYGILEPVAEERILVQDLDIIFIPLVAFSANGLRLGMGKGYYDKALAATHARTLRLGVGYACQECSELMADPWDVRLHAVLTEKGLLFLDEKYGSSLSRL